jgi:large subunit ribosomal protein L5
MAKETAPPQQSKAPAAPRPAQQKGQPQQQPRKGAQAAPGPAVAKGRPKGTGQTKPRLKEMYAKTVVQAVMKERGFTNPYQVPRLEKVVINMGVGEGRENAKILDFATADLQLISGQRPIVTRAKKSIANFKLREGVPIGAKVTLRGARMYEFLDRLINVALPRVRDFRGVPPKGFDGRGNYALGLREQLIFPEIVYDKIDKVRGMDINIVTTAQTDEDAKALLTHLGMPFRES